MNKLIVICGPTATSKTKLALKMAKKFGGGIVSVDSRQVYRGMDVGTGKDVGNVKFQISNFKSIPNDKFSIGYYLVDGVKIWLYDVVEPDQEFSVADYYELAWKVIEDIWQNGKVPFLVGGTGFYIQAVVEGIESLGIGPDWELRKRLSNLAIEQLREKLRKLDPQRWGGMNESDRGNPRRLIRVIEIAQERQKIHFNTVPYYSKKRNLRALFIGLTAPYKVLYQRIDKRVEKRVKEGIVEEIKRLLEKGYRWGLPSMSAHGYLEWQPYFEGKQSLNKVIQRWKFDEHGLARRQMVWFRKMFKRNHGLWFDIRKKDFDKEIGKIIQLFLEKDYA